MIKDNYLPFNKTLNWKRRFVDYLLTVLICKNICVVLYRTSWFHGRYTIWSVISCV